MAQVSVTRRYRFSASHRLHSAQLSGEENREVYGKCNNPHGHGHDYVLDVTLRGGVSEKSGRLVPLEALDDLVRRAVLKDMDRRNLNEEVDELAGVVPTTENLALVIAERLQRAWAERPAEWTSVLEKVKIHETKRNIFEVSLAREREIG
jgi:6-pyruvoyltetrahydropterin/6-carboxytetrahydropterin synthase